MLLLESPMDNSILEWSQRRFRDTAMRQCLDRNRYNLRAIGACDWANVERQPRRNNLALSRDQSRSFSVSRLSCCFLPLARPIRILALPRCQYSSSGTMV